VRVPLIATSLLQTTIFYLISLGAVIAALGVVRSRSTVYSILWLVLTMGLTAALFLLLKAYLIAMIQVLVYAGAILVLFLFVVMLFSRKATDLPEASLRWPRAGAALVAVLFFVLNIWVIRTISSSDREPLEGTARAIGELLFTRYALPFELTSFLLLAAVVSVVVLAKKEPQ